MRIEMIPAGNPGPYTGDGNRTWLIPGRATVLVDAGSGEASHRDALAAALESAGVSLSRVLVTHAHSDHMGGAARIAARWPEVRFAKVPWPGRDGRFEVPYDVLADGDRLAAGDEELVVIHTPGHSPDHMCLWHEATRTIFCGDLILEGGTVVIPASRGGRLADYLRSLERVCALEPSQALPAHGRVIERPIELIRGYLAHRARRELQVIDALREGLGTPEAIAARIYALAPEELRGAAEESVLAHLQKLVEEGRATVDEGIFEL
jgi:glyoxylase-like metal-dependent hydrolase (beta-lactamase superfamily II)